MLKRCNTNTESTVQIVDSDYWARKISEERKKKKEMEMNVDNWLFDSEEEKQKFYEKQRAIENGEEMEFSEEYYNYSWNDTPVAAKDEKIITPQEFYNMDYKSQTYHIYRQLLDISSLLSDIKDVVIDGTKTR